MSVTAAFAAPRKRQRGELVPLTEEQQALVHSCLRYAYRLAYQWWTRYPWRSLDDLQGAALYGLCYGAMLYDPTRGAKFVTFASYTIRTAMRNHILEADKHAASAITPKMADSLVAHERNSSSDVQDIVAMLLGAAGTDVDRRIVEMRFWQGQTYSQISRGIGLSKQAIQQRINCILGRLRRTVEVRGITEEWLYCHG